MRQDIANLTAELDNLRATEVEIQKKEIIIIIITIIIPRLRCGRRR